MSEQVIVDLATYNELLKKIKKAPTQASPRVTIRNAKAAIRLLRRDAPRTGRVAKRLHGHFAGPLDRVSKRLQRAAKAEYWDKHPDRTRRFLSRRGVHVFKCLDKASTVLDAIREELSRLTIEATGERILFVGIDVKSLGIDVSSLSSQQRDTLTKELNAVRPNYIAAVDKCAKLIHQAAKGLNAALKKEIRDDIADDIEDDALGGRLLRVGFIKDEVADDDDDWKSVINRRYEAWVALRKSQRELEALLDDLEEAADSTDVTSFLELARDLIRFRFLRQARTALQRATELDASSGEHSSEIATLTNRLAELD
ncbi:MAG: hypothetical protein AAF581_02045 [Planctomycetota bacterium]